MKILLLLFLITSSHASESLSRFERFVCRDGLALYKKNKVISYFQTNDYYDALKKAQVVHDYLEKLVQDKKNVFFNKAQVGILEDTRNNQYHVVDTLCYTNSTVGTQASVNSIFANNSVGANSIILQAHTSRFPSSGVETRDYLKLVDEYSLLEYKE